MSDVVEPELTDLERGILQDIADVRASAVAAIQQGEVAEKFFREALSYARAGKIELAERKRKAALCVYTGHHVE